uniref:Uncharacterized protein n=1 Tax=Arundo donax TaxID=35708 RepID=A0A0A9UDC8_ARUDO
MTSSPASPTPAPSSWTTSTARSTVTSDAAFLSSSSASDAAALGVTISSELSIESSLAST